MWHQQKWAHLGSLEPSEFSSLWLARSLAVSHVQQTVISDYKSSLIHLASKKSESSVYNRSTHNDLNASLVRNTVRLTCAGPPQSSSSEQHFTTVEMVEADSKDNASSLPQV